MGISNYITKSKNCSIVNNSVILDSGKSLLEFSFNNKGSVYSFEVSRDKGADINLLIDGVPYKLNPSKPKLIEVSSQVVVLSRPIKSNGKLIISKIFCDGIDISSIEEPANVIVLENSWNDFLSSVGRISGIKKTEIGVLASEYAEIKDAGNIIDIKTDPPTSWIRKNESIVFIYPCRIFEINLSTDIKKSNKKSGVSSVISNPVPKNEEIITNNKMKYDVKPIVSTINPYATNHNTETKDKLLDDIIFDSNKDGILSFIDTSSGIQQIENVINFSVSGKVLLKVPDLEPNTNYCFFVRVKSINGNGKIGIQMIDELSQSFGAKIYSSSSKDSDFVFEVRTSNFSSNYRLVLYRPLKISSGVISVSRFVIKKNHTSISNGVFVSANSIASNIGDDLITNQVPSKITNSIEFLTEGSELWFNRMTRYHTLTKNINDISFCSIDNTPKYSRVFIEEFNTDNFNTNVLIKFANCSEIITPSLSNYILLKNVFKNKKVTISGRLLPLSKNISPFNSEDKVVLFNKNDSYTDSVINNWDKSLGELIVIGGNSNSSKITLIKDVLSVEDLFSIISKSYLVLDIGECTHYVSSIIEVARYLNKKILTNNTRYIAYKEIDLINSVEDPKIIIDKIKVIYNNERSAVVVGDSNSYNESFNMAIQRIMYG